MDKNNVNMDAKLTYDDNHYYLETIHDRIGKMIIATTDHELGKILNYPFKLSKQNCDEIFGVVDVEKLADDSSQEFLIKPIESPIFTFGYEEGFEKAMELNKDKLFTEFDIIKAFEYGWNQRHFDKTDEDELREIQKRFIQSLQQPTEIEVEIEMESTRPIHAMTDKGIKTFTQKEKLDENGCLILKKK